MVTTQDIEQVLNAHADEIGTQIGANPAETQQAIAASLPALLAGLQQQAAGGGDGLQQAIAKDHDGSILDDIAGYLQGTANLDPRTTNGNGILDHLLGGQQPAVQQALSARTGLSASTIAQLLPILAPIVMGMLGRQARSGAGGGSGGGLGDLGSILGGLTGGTSGSGASGGLGDILGSILGGSQNR
jgi:hypothetical protein